MPAKRGLTMRQIRDLLRLSHEGCSVRDLVLRYGVARSTIQDNLKRAKDAGLTWPLPGDLTDDFLEKALFSDKGRKAGHRRHPEPDWALLARELKRPGVTLSVLWEEYRQVHPEGYGYSRFCELFRHFEQRLSPVMRQEHVAGDKAFVDYSGKRVPIADPKTGEVREAEIFVGVLGASNYTYAEATWTQQLSDWIASHVRMFDFYQGVPRLLVPDNLKSGVHKASFYDPEINRSYGKMADHYGVGILPARPRKPRDKAKVESGVRLAQTYILGRLRHQTFFSLAECNTAIRNALDDLNGRPMRQAQCQPQGPLRRGRAAGTAGSCPPRPMSSRSGSLPGSGPTITSRSKKFFYSVPHALIRAQVDVRMTSKIVEIFHKGRRVASHQRRYHGRRHGTHPDHMPSAHRRYADWSPDRFKRWARSFGPDTEGLIISILANRPHPEQGFRTCLGVLRLFRGLDRERVEKIAAHAVDIGALTYKSVASIIEHKTERHQQPTEDGPVIDHPNVRGSQYFH